MGKGELMYYNRLFKIMSGILLFTSCMIGSQTIQVYAGDINAEESRLLDYVNRTFEQDGLSYKVNEAYKTKLRNKLMQDDIDLTSSDIELIVGEIDNNVATGVENGYLVLTEEEEQEPTKVPDTEESNAGGENSSHGKEEGTNGSETETNGRETETTSETNQSQETTNQGTIDNQQQNSQGNTNGSETSNGKEDEGEDQTKNEAQDLSEQALKNTGYSLKSIPYLAAFLGILMVGGILSMYVLNYVEVLNETKK